MTRLVTDSIEALRPYQGGKPIEELAREKGLRNIVKLASNENALGPSKLALAAAREALCQAHRYPDAAGYRLRHALAQHCSVSFDEVIYGNGSNELLELVVRTFTTSADHIVFGQPAFSMYPVIAAAHNVAATVVSTSDDLVHQLTEMQAAIRPHTKVLLLDNPNNPAGSYVSAERVEAFLRAVPPQVIVVMDEAYFEYADAADYPDSLKLRATRERLIVLRTFSKAYGLAGFRVGYGIGPAPLIEYMNRLRAPFNVSVVSQEAAIAALSDQGHVERVVAQNTQERARLQRQLQAPGRRVFPSQANFVLVDFGMPGAQLYERLLEKGVIVRPIPSLPTHLRITVGTPEQNDRLLAAVSEVA